MQQMVRTFGQRLSEILFVKRLHIGVFMRETKGHLVVKSPQDISGYLDTWENVSFDDKRRVGDLMITTIAATSDSLNITWKI